MRAPSLMEFLQQFGGAYMSTEGALWRTLKKLLVQPGGLTSDYLRGRRRSYVLPLRLYLTISVLSLALLRVFSQGQVDARAEAQLVQALQHGTFYLTNVATWRVGKVNGQFVCEGFPAAYCTAVQRRIDTDPQAVLSALREARERALGHMGQAMFVLLPLFAAWLKLLYLRQSEPALRYTEHLVFALHLHSCWFMCLWLALLPVPFAPALAMLAGTVYALMAMRQVYGGNWWATLWRGVLLLSVQATLLGAAILVSLLWGVIA